VLKKLVEGRLQGSGCLQNSYLTELKGDMHECRRSCPRPASNQNIVSSEGTFFDSRLGGYQRLLLFTSVCSGCTCAWDVFFTPLCSASRLSPARQRKQNRLDSRFACSWLRREWFSVWIRCAETQPPELVGCNTIIYIDKSSGVNHVHI
jgi:hypothetical protein